MDNIITNIKDFLMKISLPKIELIDIIQIMIIAVLVYYFIVWVQNTRAYALIKGICVVLVFILLAKILEMETILWIAKNMATVAITGVIIVFQPELRRALEQLGQKNFVPSIIPTNREEQDTYDDQTINELVRASFEMGEVKTGALIVIEQDIKLTEYEHTGIQLDSLLSSQLLINIFEHNTPLHDGAVIVRGNRIVAATCYLPLSENTQVSKKLGTRHRAGIGISEVSDSLTIIVSEETGRVSTTHNGRLNAGLTPTKLREELYRLQKKNNPEPTKFKLWKGRDKNEEKNHE